MAEFALSPHVGYNLLTMSGISRFEALAQQLVEGTFRRLFDSHLHPLEVATHLAQAMEDGRVVEAGGRVIVPNQYWVFLHSADRQTWREMSGLLEAELVVYITRLARRGGFTLGGKPIVKVYPSAELPPGGVRVEAALLADGAADRTTQGLPADAVRNAVAASAQRWSLLHDGREIPLGEPVVRLGRALDNDITFEQPLVSRHHAELRWCHSCYLLRDLGSGGGTTVNGELAGKRPLADGDVIGLADVRLVVKVH
jgi:hypothetical protein